MAARRFPSAPATDPSISQNCSGEASACERHCRHFQIAQELTRRNPDASSYPLSRTLLLVCPQTTHSRQAANASQIFEIAHAHDWHLACLFLREVGRSRRKHDCFWDDGVHSQFSVSSRLRRNFRPVPPQVSSAKTPTHCFTLLPFPHNYKSRWIALALNHNPATEITLCATGNQFAKPRDCRIINCLF